jgi:hypothetical protein
MIAKYEASRGDEVTYVVFALLIGMARLLGAPDRRLSSGRRINGEARRFLVMTLYINSNAFNTESFERFSMDARLSLS